MAIIPPDEARDLIHLGDSDALFVSAAEYLERSPEVVPWVWRGYLARGALTMLTGPPKRGKSTLVWGLVNAVRRGDVRFLGRDVATGHVVYITEEGPGSMRDKVEPGSGLSILDHSGMFPRRPWREIVLAAGWEASRTEAVLVVVDTLPIWAGLGPDGEKDAGRMQEALEPLLELAADGVAVLVIHHNRKGGGEDGEAARGSNASAATVDAVIDLPRKPDGEDPSSRRTLLALSRWADQTPEALVYERQGDGVLVAVAEGERGEVTKRALRDRVLAAIGTGETTQQVIADEVGVTRQAVGPTLAALVQAGDVVKIESPRRNVAARFTRAAAVVETPVEKPLNLTCNDQRSAVSSPSPVGGDDNGDHPVEESVASSPDEAWLESVAAEYPGGDA